MVETAWNVNIWGSLYIMAGLKQIAEYDEMNLACSAEAVITARHQKILIHPFLAMRCSKTFFTSADRHCSKHTKIADC
jgi:hypothetical protein